MSQRTIVILGCDSCEKNKVDRNAKTSFLIVDRFSGRQFTFDGCKQHGSPLVRILESAKPFEGEVGNGVKVEPVGKNKNGTIRTGPKTGSYPCEVKGCEKPPLKTGTALAAHYRWHQRQGDKLPAHVVNRMKLKAVARKKRK